MEAVVENKVTRAATMLANGADELRSSLGRARGSVARGRVGGSTGAGSENVFELAR
jgi:hypothetical protein